MAGHGRVGPCEAHRSPRRDRHARPVRPQPAAHLPGRLPVRLVHGRRAVARPVPADRHHADPFPGAADPQGAVRTAAARRCPDRRGRRTRRPGRGPPRRARGGHGARPPGAVTRRAGPPRRARRAAVHPGPARPRPARHRGRTAARRHGADRAPARRTARRAPRPGDRHHPAPRPHSVRGAADRRGVRPGRRPRLGRPRRTAPGRRRTRRVARHPADHLRRGPAHRAPLLAARLRPAPELPRRRLGAGPEGRARAGHGRRRLQRAPSVPVRRGTVLRRAGPPRPGTRRGAGRRNRHEPKEEEPSWLSMSATS